MKNNEPLSSLIHLIGTVLAVAGLSLLVILFVLAGSFSHFWLMFKRILYI
ncbi:MAG: hypothetical protein V1831_01290 [Candidatus Woesearchaeota archaeon]